MLATVDFTVDPAVQPKLFCPDEFPDPAASPGPSDLVQAFLGASESEQFTSASKFGQKQILSKITAEQVASWRHLFLVHKFGDRNLELRSSVANPLFTFCSPSNTELKNCLNRFFN